jgi:hypothetical protein
MSPLLTALRSRSYSALPSKSFVEMIPLLEAIRSETVSIYNRFSAAKVVHFSSFRYFYTENFNNLRLKYMFFAEKVIVEPALEARQITYLLFSD